MGYIDDGDFACLSFRDWWAALMFEVTPTFAVDQCKQKLKKKISETAQQLSVLGMQAANTLVELIE